MKRIKNSLTAKIFLLTVFLLLLVSGITYACVAGFLPSTYRNALEEDLQRVSTELTEELEGYQSIQEAEKLLELFEANNQASVNVLDAEGNLVFPGMLDAMEAEAEDVSCGSAVEMDGTAEDVSYGSTVEMDGTAEDVGYGSAFEADGTAEAERMDSFVQEYAMPDSNPGTVPQLGVNIDEQGVMEGTVDELSTAIGGVTVIARNDGSAEWELDQYSTIQSYQFTVGGENYTMLVTGTMQAVNQAMAILEKIFPMVLGIILCVALICAFFAAVYLIRPIVRLSRVSRKMASLCFEEKCHESRGDEIGVLSTSLNELSDNLSTALNDLREANQKLKSDMERETVFFAAASHELKTPVTVLKGHLGGMLKNIGAYQNREYYLKRSYQVTETMEDMVQEILAISRMESGAWSIQKSRVDLAELIRLETAEVLELLEEKGMELHVDIPSHVYCEADSSMMVKVFRNFLINAIRYSPAGESIRIRMEERDNAIWFSVENSGAHIPEESLPHLFDAFYRVDNSRNRQSGGSGLGLYIVRMILSAHEADYGVENTENGVRFWFQMKQ